MSTKSKKRKINKKEVFNIVMIIVLSITLIIGVFGTVTLVGILSRTPDLDLSLFDSNQASSIYDSDGNLVMNIGEELRENVEYNQLPQSVVDAFIAVEDSRFFEHNGFDIPRFTSAIFSNIAAMSFDQGGSTFTMQLVKNTYFTSEEESGGFVVSIERKLQEINLALQLDKVLAKQEILVNYLNKINFGGPARGIQMASKYYFGKSVENLGLAEAALLAGVINSPNAYNPFYNLELATQRRNTVLNLMVRHGYISEIESEIAKATKVEDLLLSSTQNSSDIIPYQSYVDTVISEMIEKYGIDPYETPVNIYTSVNLGAQALVEQIQNNKYNGIDMGAHAYLDSAMIILDSNANIIAVGGGKNYSGQRVFNLATDMAKQSGSVIKPVLSYALAFEHLGLTTASYVNDFPIYFPRSQIRVEDYNNKYKGIIRVQEAMGDSRNVPAVELLQKAVEVIGIEGVVEYMNSLGFKNVTTENYTGQEAMGAGSFTTSPLEMAAAYNTIMNYGVYSEPTTIQRIEFLNGSSTIEANKSSHRALSAEAAYLASTLTKENIDGRWFYEYRLLAKNYPVYAKTGTSDWGTQASAELQLPVSNGAKDRWLMTSTSEYTISLWLGFDKGIVGENTYYNSYLSGLQLPARITNALMAKLETIYTNPQELSMPEGVESAQLIKGYTENYLPVEGMDPNYIVSGLYKKSGYNFKTFPKTEISSIAMDDVSIDSKTIANKVSINVQLPSYPNSEYLSLAPNATAVTFDGREYWGARGNHITWWAGTLKYYLDIKNSDTNTLIKTISSEKNSFTATLTSQELTSNNLEVCAYYAFSKISSMRSESICMPLTVQPPTDNPDPIDPGVDPDTDPDGTTD
ncbi:MAG: transglycosylase domain-containing protein [Erysipelotrichaceae bacterium]